MSAEAVGRKSVTSPKPAKSVQAKKTAAGTKAAAPKKPLRAAPVVVAPAEVTSRLHALLHTIHQIERYEERLCSMQDAIKRSGKVNAPLLRDLKALLDEIPSFEYQHDLDAVRDALPA